MNNEPVAWMYKYGSGQDDWDVGLTKESDQDIPLYTQQRPHNTVLVPCDKLAEMQAEIEALKAHLNAYQVAYKPKIVDMCLRTDANGNVLPQKEIK